MIIHNMHHYQFQKKMAIKENSLQTKANDSLVTKIQTKINNIEQTKLCTPLCNLAHGNKHQ